VPAIFSEQIVHPNVSVTRDTTDTEIRRFLYQSGHSKWHNHKKPGIFSIRENEY